MNVSHGLSWLNVPAWLPLVHALLHTLWQSALAASGLFLALRFVPARRVSLRYGLSTAALALVLLLGLGSWSLLTVSRSLSAGAAHSQSAVTAATGHLPGNALTLRADNNPALVGGQPDHVKGIGLGMTSAGSNDVPKVWVRWVAVSWLIGVGLSLLRAVKGVFGAGHLRRRCRALVDPRILALAEELRGRLGLPRRVRFLVSEEITVPAVMGVLRPAVLLPAMLLTGAPAELLRAILAHELAHIRRWDYLVNLGQMLVESLLFFNPFVWWISRQMRLEREACCDQLAVEECQSPAHYVEALVAVISRSRPAAACSEPLLAASGPHSHGGDALDRARRLLVPGYQPVLRLRWFNLAAVLALSGLVLGGLSLGTRAIAETIRMNEAKGQPMASPVGSSSAGSKGASPAPEAGGTKEVSEKVLAAARAGDAKRALSLLEDSSKPKEFGEEEAARTFDELIRARELRAFTTLYDSWRRLYAKNWRLSDELLAALVRDQRTDFLDALLARRFDLDRLTKAAGSADPTTAGWITRRVAEVARQQADIEALGTAAADNDLPGLQRLVDGGADVNGVSKDDNTPLIRAVFKNRLEAAQWLLDHGALVDKPRLPGWNYTPLCLVNSVPMAELLKKHGADVHAKLYERDESILTYVAGRGKADVVAWFLKQGLDARMIGDDQQNLLFGLKDGATAEVLLAAGADPNHVDEFGGTPLTAARSGEVVRVLVRHGADLKPKFKDGVTLLEKVVNSTLWRDGAPQEQAYIEELIKQGAEFDPKGNGVRAMIQAASLDRVGEVRAFLDHGVSPDASYERESVGHVSALSEAAFQAPQSLKLLLERGADPNAPVPADRLTPVSTALTWGAFGNVDLLRQAGAKGVSDLAYHSAKGDFAEVKVLLDQHADPNEASTPGFTALSYAVRHAQVEVARLLLDRGANVNAFDASGFSPYVDFLNYRQMISGDSSQAKMQWHLSAPEAKARLNAFEQLFAQHLPDRTYRDTLGRTALHQAAWSGTPFALGLMLGEKPLHFDPNLGDKEGRTALLLAALSPTAKDLKPAFTISDKGVPTQSWNQQAYATTLLLKNGARLDLVGPGGRTVGELALQAARDANNAQLAAVLSAAGAEHPNSGDSGPEKASTLSTATPATGENATPTPIASPATEAPVLSHKLVVTPRIKKAFRGTDAIEIREITGTEATFQIGGVYRVTGTCRQQTLKNAELYLGNTAKAGSDSIAPMDGSSLYKTLPNGTTEFGCTFKLLRPGTLHITIYDLDDRDKTDNAYAGLLLGDVVDKP